jgi:hypothetical protein
MQVQRHCILHTTAKLARELGSNPSHFFEFNRVARASKSKNEQTKRDHGNAARTYVLARIGGPSAPKKNEPEGREFATRAGRDADAGNAGPARVRNLLHETPGGGPLAAIEHQDVHRHTAPRFPTLR